MKERGIEVGRVGAWHEAKARAVEVREMARELAGQVRDWIGDYLDRAGERVLDRVRPARPGLAYEGGQTLGRTGADRAGDVGRERETVQEPERDLATRLREAWEARQAGFEVQRDTGALDNGSRGDRQRDDTQEPERARDAPEDFAARLREAAAGVDRDALAGLADSLREGREAEAQHKAQEVAREREVERVREVELAKERERVAERERGRGLGYGR